MTIARDIAESLQQEAATAETMGTLTARQLHIIYQQKWFKLFVPAQYGGLEASLPQGLQIEEALATIDGSLGWTVTLCSGATMFVGYLQPAVAADIFNDEKVCFGGSGRATGTAQINEQGYEVSGVWHYATGAPHNTIFTANCAIEKEGKPVLNQDGSPLIKSFFFKREEVTIRQNWNMMGLKATAGHTFEVRFLQVPQHRSFVIDSAHATLPHPVYHYPFLQFAEATLAVNTLGMAQHFLNECSGILRQKETQLSVSLQKQWEEATSNLNNLRQQFYAAVAASWEVFLTGNKSDQPSLQAVSHASRRMAAEARGLVQELYPYCGMTAANVNAPLNRIWRDIFTASQHSLLHEV